MKAPRKLKCDVSNKIPYQFLEKKKQNKNKFESNYETKPQTALAGTKHAITTDTNKTIHRKLISNPLPNSFQNAVSRRGENRRGPDGKFAQKSAKQVEEDIEEEPEEIEQEKIEEQDPSTPNTSIETLDDSFDFAAPIQVGRGRKKQPQSTKTNTPGKDNLKMHVENMNEEQLQQARETIAENPRNVTMIDNNGNDDDNYNIKTEIIEPENTNNVQVRRSTRIKTTNPINRLGNPITH